MNFEWWLPLVKRWESGVFEIGAQSSEYEVGKTVSENPTEFKAVVPEKPRAFTPEDAVKFASERSALLGNWPREFDASVRQIITQAVADGWPTRKTVEALREVFTDFSTSRLETIARTETTAAFNAGRMAHFERLGDWIPGYQWISVLDARTTKICFTRNGRILLQGNTEGSPPAHYNCRSILSPITALEMNRLRNHDPEAEQRAFGWFTGAPKNIEEALDWSRVEPRMAGF